MVAILAPISDSLLESRDEFAALATLGLSEAYGCRFKFPRMFDYFPVGHCEKRLESPGSMPIFALPIWGIAFGSASINKARYQPEARLMILPLLTLPVGTRLLMMFQNSHTNDAVGDTT